MKTAAILRLQLFKVSESFIPNQASGYRDYRPVYVGRRKFASPPEGASFLCERASKIESIIGQIAGYVPSLERQLRPLRPDILHAHFAVDGVYAVPLAKALSVPLITTLHGFDVTRHDGSLLASLRPALVNTVLHRSHLIKACSKFICVSDFIKRAALQKGFPEDKLLTHYIGIDTNSMTPQPDRRDPSLIVHVARLVEKKGTSYLLRALSKLVSEGHTTLKLVIIGDGPLRPVLEAEAQSIGIGHFVTFMGAVPNSEVKRILPTAAMMIVPSVTARNGDAEGFGIVNLEAAAFGVPVVCYNSGGIAEAVEDGVTGFVVPEKDIDGLATRMRQLLEDVPLAQRLGQQARQNAEQNFDIGKQSRKLEIIYDSVREVRGE